MKNFLTKIILICLLTFSHFLQAKEISGEEYIVGADDVLEVTILQPERLTTTVTVAPDGRITVFYIGAVYVEGMSLAEIEDTIQAKLSDGYMRYPVVLVTLQASRSRKFFVYGEVKRPGIYLLQDDTTVLQAISVAGGLTKFGSSGRIKVLRKNRENSNYETIKADIKAIIDGSSKLAILLEPGDIVVVSEGAFNDKKDS